MKTTIGPWDAASRTVMIKFEHGGIRHSRAVNAVCADDGSYDAAATEARVAEVAKGVEYKIGLGVITNAPPVLPPAL